MASFTLFDLVLSTVGVLLTMALVCCLCCLCMKISDLKLKYCIIETAQKKGLEVDVDKLESKSSTAKDDTCTIIVPEVVVVI